MKRLTDEEKKYLGILINYYRNLYFRSKNKYVHEFKQVNFCKNICSQTQLSRIENGEIIQNQEIYVALLKKLNLSCEKVAPKDIMIFNTYVDNILISQNDDKLVINYSEYVTIVNNYQFIFRKNIIYTHYNYVLEFILAILNNDLEEASLIINDIEKTLEILPEKLLILALQYIGKYYHLRHDYDNANKYYLISLEHMHKYKINNPIIYLDIAYNYLKNNQFIYAVDYLNKAINSYIDSNNYITMARIYKIYALIYLYNRNYDAGLNYLMDALEYIKDGKKILLTKKINNLIAVVSYLKGESIEALNIINNSIDLEEGKLLYYIFSNNFASVSDFSQENYCLVMEFYSSTNKEIYYENIINPIINQLPDEIRLVIIYDIFKYFKNTKKYKKVLDLIEKYHLSY